MSAITDPKDLESNRYYVLGFEREDGSMDWGPIYLHVEGEWFTEDGEEVEQVFDPFLQLYVSPNSADAYQ